MDAEFRDRIAAYDGTEGTAYALGRWVALARPDLQQTASPEAVAQAVAVEATFYVVGDGDEPLSALVTALLTAQTALAPTEPA